MANYQAVHAQIVPVLFQNESNLVTAPASPIEGHWFGVINLDHGASAYTTEVDGNGAPIQTPIGRGTTSPRTEVRDAFRCYIWTFINGQWRITGGHMPDISSELWEYSDPGGLNPLAVVGLTRVPLTFADFFSEGNYYFEPVGDGSIRCLKRFVGIINLVGYFDLVMTGNNQYAAASLTINVISGQANARAGNGIQVSASSPRAGSQPQSGALPTVGVIEAGAVLEMIANDDPTQSGTTFVLDQTSIDFQAV